MRIVHYLNQSFIDYPGKIAAVVFTGGCNFSCPFCHNAEIVKNQHNEITQTEIQNRLLKRKKWLDGICITGGEPLLFPDTVDFIKWLKSEGFLVKLDTNGTFPDRLFEITSQNLIDALAIDIKNIWKKYPVSAGCDINAVIKIRQSLQIAAQSRCDVIFRTTVVPGLHEPEDISVMRSYVPGFRYEIQQFRPGSCLNENYNELEPFSSEEWESFTKIL